jgi:ribose transport system ATP-binding protein
MIEFRGISHDFGTVPVLRDVSFAVPPGATLGLVGENGAGKSTLMNVLGGNVTPRSGEMYLGGQPYAPRSPAEAVTRGVAFIHQELNLFPNLSIAENIFLTSFPTRLGLLRKRDAMKRTMALLDEVGLEHSPNILVERLSPGQRQLVEIAKALSFDARLVIFDEPTSSLSAREAEVLFELLGLAPARHFRDLHFPHIGRRAAPVRRHRCAQGRCRRRVWATRFVHRGTHDFPHGRPQPDSAVSGAKRFSVSETALEARGLTHPGIARGITFQLRRGEVLGVSGLMGAGRPRWRAYFLIGPLPGREVLLAGRPLKSSAPALRIRQGLAFVTENRREEGLCLAASIAENTGLASLRRFARRPFGWIDRIRNEAAIADMRIAVRLTPTARNTQPVATLSGGNQQKVVLAKWLLAQPLVLILDEPTRGIDIGAKYDIYQLIHQLADRGAGVLIISSEIEELIGVCDRILVMAKGEIRDALSRSEFDRERIMRAAVATGKS